ncbi:MAG: hypothetical protein NW217_12535 [Hyphomicrobiaceae bacterium]|nr:hypothetical protein [Hyphomicrobiaceae bacterium]
MNPRALAAVVLAVSAVAVGGCASDGSLSLATGSLQDQAAAKTPRIDPACVALMARIEELRREGTPQRIEKVSSGKGATVSVKREALARMTELDKANGDFQNKCSTLAAASTPAQTAAAAPAAAAAAAPAAGAAAPKSAETKAAAVAAQRP